MTISGPSSAAVGTAYKVTVSLTPPLDGTQVMLTPSGCPAPVLSAPPLTATTTNGGVATFNLTFTAIGACTLSASATNYNPSGNLNFTVYKAGDLACNSSSYPTSNGPGDPMGPLDPEADITYTVTGWGLKRFDNVNSVPCSGNPVNYTLTPGTAIDGSPAVSLVYDKTNPADPSNPQVGSFKYVVVLDPRLIPSDGWPSLHPQVSWKLDGSGNPIWTPGLGCLSDNMSIPGGVMPPWPTGYSGTTDNPPTEPVKMSIAQAGWAPTLDQPGNITYWAIIIDQADSNVKFP